MEQGPTRGAGHEQWRSHERAARLLRVVMLLLPVAVSLVVTVAAGRIVARPAGLGATLAWWIAITAVSTLSLVATARLLRRFLPVVAMLRLSLVFPDEAPSRFRLALRTGTAAQLQRQLDAGAVAPTAQAHAEHLLALAGRIGDHDRLTRGHSERVRAYADMIGEEMKLDRHDRDLLHWSALLHDIGKLEVPGEILNKRGRPDDHEWEALKRHPAAAAPYLDPLASWLGEWRHAATEHHERWDGGGYPRGLRGDQITLAGRIVAVADAYDTITSVRSYKKAMSPEDARAEIARCAGGQFDPAVVKAFLAVSVGDLQRVMGPISWLAQVPVLATAPSTAVPVLSNAVVSTATAGAVAVSAFTAGITAPPAPVDRIEAVSAVVDVQDLPVDLAFALPTPTPSTKAPVGSAAPAQPDGAADDARPATRPDRTPRATPTPGLRLILPTPTPTPTRATDSSTRATPTPTPTSTPTPLPARPDATTPPAAAPTATPVPATPTTAPTATPPPSTPVPSTPTPEPPPAGRRWFLQNPGTGATASSSSLPLAAGAPSGLGLPNFDTDRDDDPGLVLRRGATSFATTDPTRIQTWAVNTGASAISGRASVRLFASPREHDWERTGRVRVALQRCAADLVDCTTLATGEAAFDEPILWFFAQVDVDLGVVTTGTTPGRPMTVLRVIVPPSSDDDVWLAYDNGLYPARLDVGG